VREVGVLYDLVTILDYLAKNVGPGSTLIGEMGEQAEKADHQEVPVGHNLMYTTWDLHLTAAEPHTAAPDNDGNVWVTEWGAHMVTRVQISTGQVTQYELKTPNLRPFSIGIAPDGKAWFTAGPELGVIDPKSNTMTELKVPGDERKTVNGSHLTISDGKVWFGASSPGRIVSYDPKDQQFKSYKIEDGAATPDGITKHGDKFWFVLGRATKVGYLEPDTGKVQTFPVPTAHINSEHLTVDQKGRVWLA
jgi:streptogramin lyase